jgi:hypothetical protein
LKEGDTEETEISDGQEWRVMAPLNVAQMIRNKIEAGVLPPEPYSKRLLGYGRGQLCSGCEQPITEHQAAHEFHCLDCPTLCFHAGCAAIYETELARGGRSSRLRNVAGGSDAAVDAESDLGLVTRTIVGTTLCAYCIARKTGLCPERVDDTLKLVARLVWLSVGKRRCSGCLQSKTTFGITTENGEAAG